MDNTQNIDRKSEIGKGWKEVKPNGGKKEEEEMENPEETREDRSGGIGER